MAIKIKGTTIINDEDAFIDFAGNTGLKLPVGTSAQRPAGVTGQLRYNSTDNIFEGYDGTEWGPISGAGGGGIIAEISETEPVEAEPGKLWWDSTEGVLKVYFDDGTSQQWVDASPTLQGEFVEDISNIILDPVGISPANEEEIPANTAFTLQASQYENTDYKEHASSDWQIASDASFDTIVFESLNDANNLTSIEVTNGIPGAGTHYWRVRYRDTAGNVSNFSVSRLIKIFPVLGDALGGGFYIGTTSVGATCYYLIVAPNVSGCAQCAWKTTRTTTSGTSSLINGFANTYPAMQNTTHPAGNWTATRTIGGFSDWYLPARDELNQLYGNKNTLPAGEAFSGFIYWSSTETNCYAACGQCFTFGSCHFPFKTGSYRLRAVRRTPI